LAALASRLEQQLQVAQEVQQQQAENSAAVQQAAAGVAEASAAAAAAAASRCGGMGNAGQPRGEAGEAGEQALGVVELQLMLGQLQRMEEQEEELRCVGLALGCCVLVRVDMYSSGCARNA